MPTISVRPQNQGKAIMQVLKSLKIISVFNNIAIRETVLKRQGKNFQIHGSQENLTMGVKDLAGRDLKICWRYL